MSAPLPTFIVECHACKAKVAAEEYGKVIRQWHDEDGEPYGQMLALGTCQVCRSPLVGEATQIDFEGLTAADDDWTDFVRVYPRPPKVFTSSRIPRVVKDSLVEADRTLQAGANIATVVMLGRALEALCRHVVSEHADSNGATAGGVPAPAVAAKASGNAQAQSPAQPPVGAAVPGKPASKKVKHLMLDEGLSKLKSLGVIDTRLYDWSQQLRAFRNLAAHPEDIAVSRRDAEDLATFTTTIVEYVYDLSERYDEFKRRNEKKSTKSKGKSGDKSS